MQLHERRELEHTLQQSEARLRAVVESLPFDFFLIDADQIRQVLNNLLMNSAQAMSDGGVIRISARNRLISQGTETLAPGRFIEVKIEDDGTGIAAEHLQQVFDPYFTTKTTGQGLGMSIVFSIVKRHGGSIAISSELDKGTIVVLSLPAATEQPKAHRPAPTEPEHGIGRVLVMEDDDYVRKVTCMMLTHLGFTPIATSGCQEAVAAFKRALADEQPFDTVILDLTVPGGPGGLECLGNLRALDPQVKAIVASGYSNDPVLSDHLNYGFAGVLTKPFKIGVLSQVLKQVLSDDQEA